MSQDLRRERAGVSFETIAGATNYIAELEAVNDRIVHQIAHYERVAQQELDIAKDALRDRHDLTYKTHYALMRDAVTASRVLRSLMADTHV